MDRRDMDERDKELLDKQLRRFGSAGQRHDGTMILALVAVFLAGMTIGAFAFAYKAEPMGHTSTTTASAQPIPAPPIAR